MDAHGVDAACILGGGFMEPGSDYRLGNDFMLAVIKRLPERLIGFAHVNPHGGKHDVLAELDRMQDRGIRCIKLINAYQKYPGDGPVLMAVYEYAARRGMLVFNHAWDSDVMMRIAPRFPGVDFIFGHYHAGLDAVLKDRPNVYTNIWSVDSSGFLDRGIANVGAGKFMLGSDAFGNPMSVGIGLVVFAHVGEADKRLILGLTAARLLDKAGALPGPIRRKYRSIAAGRK
jgi:predicted TIM-barrel fold metal-dependent hydrolase